MPELPDIEVYRESLEARIEGRVLNGVRLKNPFLLRTAVPPIADATGRRVTGLRRLGKRIPRVGGNSDRQDLKALGAQVPHDVVHADPKCGSGDGFTGGVLGFVLKSRHRRS